MSKGSMLDGRRPLGVDKSDGFPTNDLASVFHSKDAMAGPSRRLAVKSTAPAYCWTGVVARMSTTKTRLSFWSSCPSLAP